MGQITNLANYLIEKCAENSCIKNYLSKKEDWNDFVQNKLRFQNERNETDLGDLQHKACNNEKYEAFQEDNDDYDRIFKNYDIFSNNENLDENSNETSNDEEFDGLDVFYKTFSNSYTSDVKKRALDSEEIFEDIKFNDDNCTNFEIKDQYFEDCNLKKVNFHNFIIYSSNFLLECNF